MSARKKMESGISGNVSFFSIFIPLYLVVLAFFILLVSKSNYEPEKKQKALHSVKKTFDPADLVNLSLETGIYDSIGKEVPVKHYFEMIAKVARDELELIEADVLEVGDRIQVNVPTAKLFEGKNNFVAKDNKDLLTKITGALASLDKDQRYEVELIFSDESVVENPSNTPNRNVYRAGALARTLASLGVPEQNIIIGIGNQSPNNVQMNFYKRDVSEYYGNLN